MQPMIDQIGGEEKVRTLVDHFYDLIEAVPEGRAIMDMHLKGHGLAHVRPAQFEFLCGFFGGRRYYEERHGHMNLRMMHAHLAIRAADAEDWLAVMAQTLVDCAVPSPQRDVINQAFRKVAMSLVNEPQADLPQGIN